MTIRYRINYNKYNSNDKQKIDEEELNMVVHGEMLFDVFVGVDSYKETSALMEANLKYHPELTVGYELIAIDCNGERHKVDVNCCKRVKLDEVIEDYSI